jgi:hypothetical protein
MLRRLPNGIAVLQRLLVRVRISHNIFYDRLRGLEANNASPARTPNPVEEMARSRERRPKRSIDLITSVPQT